MDTASEIRLQAVCPVLADRVRSVDAEFQRQTEGDHIEIVQGLRSWNEQQKIWEKGRKLQADGKWIVTDTHAVVTNAPPGHSWHEFGLAVDVVPRSLLPIPGWNPESIVWRQIRAIAESCGFKHFDCGGNWKHKDLPHLQLSGKFGVSPDDEVRQLFKDGGMIAVWHESGVMNA